MKRKVGIFLPGRVESERLPNKLLLPLDNKGITLWEIGCRKLKELKDLGYEVFVLCNGDKFINIANKYEVPIIERDIETCRVDGPLTYIYKELENNVNGCTHMIFMNGCLINLSVKTLITAIEYFSKEDSKDYITSVIDYKNWLWREEEDTSTTNVTPIDYKRLSTKEITNHFQAAHAFHGFNIKNFFEDGMMLKEDCELIYVDKSEIIDVDNASDFRYVKYLYNNAKVKKSTFVVDLDGTLFHTNGMDYENSTPDMFMINTINKMFINGNTVIIDTARGFSTPEKIKELKDLTEKQLREFGVLYTYLRVGVKIPADMYIDDKATNVKDFREKVFII